MKGIVSSSLFNQNRDCDALNFALYTNVFKFTEWIKYPAGRTCGTMSVSTSLIQGGSLASKELFPWSVLVINNAVEPDKTFYLTTGTLISNRHVIVPASFVVFKPKGDLKPAANFKMYFGIFKMKHITYPDVVSAGVSRIIAHEKYNRENLAKEANLAILFADQTIYFSDQVQSVCLPPYRDNSNDILSGSGYVAGWGFDEKKNFAMKKKMLQMRVDDKETCSSKWGNQLKAVQFSKFFCASPSRSGSPCTGDGPFYVKSGNLWLFRGWLAIKGTCNPSDPFVFEDIAFYSRWIDEKMKA